MLLPIGMNCELFCPDTDAAAEPRITASALPLPRAIVREVVVATLSWSASCSARDQERVVSFFLPDRDRPLAGRLVFLQVDVAGEKRVGDVGGALRLQTAERHLDGAVRHEGIENERPFLFDLAEPLQGTADGQAVLGALVDSARHVGCNQRLGFVENEAVPGGAQRQAPASNSKKHRGKDGAEEGGIGIGKGREIGEHNVSAVHDGTEVQAAPLPQDASEALVAQPSHQAIFQQLHERQEIARMPLGQEMQVLKLAPHNPVVEVFQ